MNERDETKGNSELQSSIVGEDNTSPSGEGAQIDEAKLLRKIDKRLLPMLFIIYVAAFLDRVNISNALTMGLPHDLHLTGNQPNVVLTMFFIPYVIFEIPANLILTRIGPRIWLSGCTVTFGIAMLGQGFVKNYGGILATRFFLGMAEAGIFPGCIYLISVWYKQRESQKRFTFYWSAVLLSGAFGGLLASAIAKMDGIAGLPNWRWIFILEGIATIIVGAVAFFFVVDFPDQAHWLSQEERAFVKHRTSSGMTPSRTIGVRDVYWFFKSARRVSGAFAYWGVVVPIYSYSYFAPTIIKSLGYSVVQTQLRSVVPFAAAFVLCTVIAIISDRTHTRVQYVAFGQALTITGLVLLMSVHRSFGAQYGGLCLIAMGSFTTSIGICCWYVMNLHGHVERSIGSAWMAGFGNTGGIVATFAFLTRDAPLYKMGYAICIASISVSVLGTVVYSVALIREKRRQGSDTEIYSL